MIIGIVGCFLTQKLGLFRILFSFFNPWQLLNNFSPKMFMFLFIPCLVILWVKSVFSKTKYCGQKCILKIKVWNSPVYEIAPVYPKYKRTWFSTSRHFKAFQGTSGLLKTFIIHSFYIFLFCNAPWCYIIVYVILEINNNNII